MFFWSLRSFDNGHISRTSRNLDRRGFYSLRASCRIQTAASVADIAAALFSSAEVCLVLLMYIKGKGSNYYASPRARCALAGAQIQKSLFLAPWLQVYGRQRRAEHVAPQTAQILREVDLGEGLFACGVKAM